MTRPLRTLLHVFPTFAVGGAQMRFVQLANHFGRRYRHVIVAMNGNAEAFGRLSGDIDARLMSVPMEGAGLWTRLVRFRRVLDEVRPDLLVTSNWGSIEWALANVDGRYPHLHTEDGFGPEEIARQLPRRVWTRRLALRRALVMLPSRTLHHLAEHVWRLPRHILRHIPNGVDCQRFSVAANIQWAATLGFSPHEPVIGTVAALRPEKNLFLLLDAFAQVTQARPARLVIVGDGPERAALETHSRLLGINGRVVFAGACAEPERLLPTFDVFALSSRTEQMPLSVLEAMAAGLPVAATDVGDVRNMVSEENQPFVVAGEPRALARSLASLLDSPAKARLVGEANARRARTAFDQSLMFTAYGALFDGGTVRTEERTRRTLSSQV